jgi:hypothetical protein
VWVEQARRGRIDDNGVVAVDCSHFVVGSADNERCNDANYSVEGRGRLADLLPRCRPQWSGR